MLKLFKKLDVLFVCLLIGLATWCFKPVKKEEYFLPLYKLGEVSNREVDYSGNDLPNDKIWLQCANNVKKLQAYARESKNFEIDVRFNQELNDFNVGHDEDNVGNSLEEMLTALPDMQERYFWLDFKNLGSENKDKALKRLLDLMARHNLKPDHFIVESGQPDCLEAFTLAGFQTSYYFPCLNVTEDLSQLEKQLKSAVKKFDASNVKYVSADAAYFDYLRHYFPNIQKLVRVMTEKKTKMEKVNDSISTDPTVKVILNRDTEHF